MPALRPRWLPRKPDWHAILTLQRPRRAQLRTRVLAGVLAVTVLALVAFDFAAVGALRRYLLGHTDAQLESVLGLYRPMTVTLPGHTNWVINQAGAHRKPPPGVHPPTGLHVQQVLAGPRFEVPTPNCARIGAGTSNRGPASTCWTR